MMPGVKFSTKTSEALASSRTSSTPAGRLRSITIDFLLRLQQR
jgi:hypothetical protein